MDDLPSSKDDSPAEMEEVKNKENAKLLSKIKPNDFVVLLDLGKEQPDSGANGGASHGHQTGSEPLGKRRNAA